MRKKDTALLCVERLEKLYPKAECSLNYNNAFELLIAVRLSAQCTDARVNLVTPELFKEFPDADAFANADVKRIEQLIISCGLYKTKAKDLINIGKDIVNKYDGKVPDTIEKLTTLSGVGRKTANLVCGDIYGKPAVVTDTHFIRICNRLGFVNTKDPLKVENEMRKLLPPERSNGFCHRTVLFGRDICTARTAHCEKCILNDICPKKITKKR